MSEKDKNKLRSKIDNSLESLLESDSLLDDSQDEQDNLPNIKPNTQHDYVAMKNNASGKAKKTILSLMKFYLDADIIENDEYIKARRKIDEMTLSSLMFQLESAEKALVTLLQTIDGGELAPRMFEVLGTLQKSMLDIIKSQTMYLVSAEESVKKLARDMDALNSRQNKRLNDSSDSGQINNVNRGTKNLMQSIQNEINSDDIEDIEEENDEYDE